MSWLLMISIACSTTTTTTPTSITAPTTQASDTRIIPSTDQEAATARPWTGLDANDAPSTFQFVVVSDRTGEHRAGVFRDAMAKIDLLEPAFVVSVGDLIEGYSNDQVVLDAEWDEIEGYVASLKQPFFYAAGNHDMSNEVMAETWQERFGPSFYSFRYKDVRFLVLNSELFGMVHDPAKSLPGPFTQADQMAFVEKTLREDSDSRWTIVLIHQPLWDASKIHPDWLKIEAMLASRPHTVFAGHNHRYVRHRRNNQSYITLATTGGGSPMRGARYGEFDQVALVTMAEDGPVIANLDLEGIHDENVATPADRELLRALSLAVQAERVDHKGASFTGGTSRFRVRNPTSRPMTVDAAAVGGPEMKASPETSRLVLAPGESTLISFSLSSDDPIPFESLASGRVRWTLRGRAENGKDLTLETGHALLPEKALPIPHRTTPVNVDGDLGEWSSLPLGAPTFSQIDHGTHYEGPADAELQFAIESDETHLFIAAKVTDDTLIVSPTKTAREQDGITLQIDARPDPERSSTRDLWSAVRAGEFQQLILVTASIGDPAEDHVLKLFTPSAPAGLEYAIRRTPNGYNVEFSLPLTAISERQGRNWEAIRVNLSLYDSDSPDESPATLWWRPNRFGNEAIAGSGTFLR